MIKSDDQLNDRFKAMAKIRRQIAKQAFQQTWDIACDHINKFNPTGNEAVSQMASLGAEMAAYFIMHAKRIADADQAGVTLSQISNSVTEMIHGLIETKELRNAQPKNYGRSEIKTISLNCV